MRLVKYDNKLVVVNGNALEISDNSYIVITTNKKLATLTCGSQSYTLTGDDLSHAFPVEAGTYTCTATLDGTTNSKSVTVTTPTVYNVGISLSQLPVGYTEIEYLQSSGTQYIDTLIVPSENTSIEIEIGKNLSSSTSGNGIFGNDNVGARWAGLNGFRSGFGTASWTTSTVIQQDINTVVFNKTTPTFNGSALSISAGTSYGTANLYIYRTTTSYSSTKVYSMKIYNNGTLVRNFVPARQNNTNEVGMYDLVSDTLFVNSGTGVFIAGPDVN